MSKRMYDLNESNLTMLAIKFCWNGIFYATNTNGWLKNNTGSNGVWQNPFFMGTRAKSYYNFQINCHPPKNSRYQAEKSGNQAKKSGSQGKKSESQVKVKFTVATRRTNTRTGKYQNLPPTQYHI